MPEFNAASLNEWCADHGGLERVVYIGKTDDERGRAAVPELRRRFGIKLQVAEGVDGKDLFCRAQKGEYVPELDQVDSLSFRHIVMHKLRDCHEVMYTPGMVGCALSHRRELDGAAARRGCTLVLESDAIFSRGATRGGRSDRADKVWSDIVAETNRLPPGTDAVWLAPRNFPQAGIKSLGPFQSKRHLKRIVDIFIGNKMVLWTPAGARRTLDLMRLRDPACSFQCDIVFGAMARRYNDAWAEAMRQRCGGALALVPGSARGTKLVSASPLVYLAAGSPVIPTGAWDLKSAVQASWVQIKPCLPPHFHFYAAILAAAALLVATTIVAVCFAATRRRNR